MTAGSNQSGTYINECSAVAIVSQARVGTAGGAAGLAEPGTQLLSDHLLQDVLPADLVPLRPLQVRLF